MIAQNQLDANLVKTYNLVSKTYLDFWTEPHPWLDLERATLLSLLPSKAALLEIGCGPGHDCAFFTERGLDCLGIDQSDGMIDIARRQHPNCRFAVANADDISALEMGFDAIWIVYVLEHLPRERLPAILAAAQAVLNPGGLLGFVTVIDDETVEEVRPVPGVRDAAGQPIPIYSIRWNKDELLSHFTGFEVVWSRTVAHASPAKPTLSCIVRQSR